MHQFYWRTEDIRADDLLEYFVETKEDRQLVEILKSRQPTILVGSRSVGKSFLLRVAEQELIIDFEEERVLPVYVSFTKSALVNTNDTQQFQHWMLARLCKYVVRALSKQGLVNVSPQSISVLAGGDTAKALSDGGRIGAIVKQYEESWDTRQQDVDISGLPSVDQLKEVIENICETLDVKRLSVFFDEAAHILIPEQQRQFFTLFRDLRSPYLTCNAAVYPGVTVFGDTFQPVHDATTLKISRDVLSDEYLLKMREIAEKQADSKLITSIARNTKNFDVLAYAAHGNPRLLLKTLESAPKVSSNQVGEVIRNYYRSDIWSEHSSLADKYRGYRQFIDWGRAFIEEDVLAKIQEMNTRYLSEDKKTSCFFWINRDAPEVIRESLRLLEYTGIISEQGEGIKATRSEIGTRYTVNLGCLMALESNPVADGLQIAQNLTPKRMTEYGANNKVYDSLVAAQPQYHEPEISEILNQQLDKTIDVLDITAWQKTRLHDLSLSTIGDVLHAPESQLMEAYYVGEKRSRRMKNAAQAAVFEYLSG